MTGKTITFRRPVPFEVDVDMATPKPLPQPERVAIGTAESCTCEECVSACAFNPGIFLPAEAKLAIEAGYAKRMMLYNEVVPMRSGRGRVVAYLMPAVPHMGGKSDGPMTFGQAMLLVVGGRGRGKCTFLTRAGRCRIHDSGFKPAECRGYLGCGPHDAKVDEKRDRLIRSWTTPEGRAVIDQWRAALEP